MVGWRATDAKYLEEVETSCAAIHLNAIAPDEAVQYFSGLNFETVYDEEQDFVRAWKYLPFWAGFGRMRAICHVTYEGVIPIANDADIQSDTLPL